MTKTKKFSERLDEFVHEQWDDADRKGLVRPFEATTIIGPKIILGPDGQPEMEVSAVIVRDKNGQTLVNSFKTPKRV